MDCYIPQGNRWKQSCLKKYLKLKEPKKIKYNGCSKGLNATFNYVLFFGQEIYMCIYEKRDI